MQDQTRDRQDKDQERTAPAAEADVLGEAARNTGTMEGLVADEDKCRAAPDDERGQAQPGQVENQAGFVKDPDKKFSP
ncbi:MAG TPA: hypothetical protein VGF26_14860 [Ramlibacter sp.]